MERLDGGKIPNLSIIRPVNASILQSFHSERSERFNEYVNNDKR